MGTPAASMTARPARGPGRPRSARAHQAILSAAIALLAEDGYEGMSMEAVAHRAGVGKATIYRRWPSKDDLVIEAMACLPPELEPVDSGSVRGDLLAVAAQVARHTEHGAAQLLPRLMSEAAKNPELLIACKRALVKPRRELIARILERGRARGEIRDDLDLDLMVDMVTGPVTYRLMVSGGTALPDRRFIEQLTDALLRGIATRP